MILYNAGGKPLRLEQIGQVSIRRTCGDCHDVDALSRTVHFNRAEKNPDPENSDCLTCHLEPHPFTAQGTIRKTTALPSDSACVTCHSNLWNWSKRPRETHQGMTCLDCHKDAGHKTAARLTCRSCHLGGKSAGAPRPAHKGFPSLHLKRLACETCHIRKTPDLARPGYIISRAKRIWPVTEDESLVHHNVAPSKDSLGARGCTDCHWRDSRFFFGRTLTGATTAPGKPISVVNRKSMHVSRTNVLIGAIRETYIKPISGWVFIFMIVVSATHYLVFGPRRAHVDPNEPEVQRFTPIERIMHLTALVSFVALALTGMTFLFHLESAQSLLRPIHGYIGPFFTLAVLTMLSIWWRNALFVSCDKDWVCKLGGYLWIRGECPAEKFNAGQKMFYWFLVIAGGLTVSVTGILLLAMRGFAPPAAYTLHDLAAIAVVSGIIGHAYLSIFANPGTVHSMLTGRVRRSWAEHHHPLWLQRYDALHEENQPQTQSETDQSNE